MSATYEETKSKSDAIIRQAKAEEVHDELMDVIDIIQDRVDRGENNQRAADLTEALATWVRHPWVYYEDRADARKRGLRRYGSMGGDVIPWDEASFRARVFATANQRITLMRKARLEK